MIVCFPLFFISPDRFKTESGKFRTGRCLCSIQEKIIEVQFSSECKVRVFANCSKNRTKVLKCIFKSSCVLGFAKYWGLSKKKNPQWVGKYKNFEMHYSQSPHISPGSPPPSPPPSEEADDKCITCTSKQFHSLCKLPFVTQSTF